MTITSIPELDLRWALLVTAALVTGCSDLHPFPLVEEEAPSEHVPCADRNALRNLYFGDLHSHTRLSWDARSYDDLLSPADAYRFARGETVDLPPHDEAGMGQRLAQLDRPLDFTAVTDHGEFLGETAHCETPGALGYDSDVCVRFRTEVGAGAFDFGLLLAQAHPWRYPELCGEDGLGCTEAAAERWGELRDAAEEAYDRGESCEFTSFVGYEYTRTPFVTNLHRYVVFAGQQVPDLPVTAIEQPDILGFLRALRDACPGGESGCDAISVPHNSNLSNGRLFYPEFPDGASLEEQAALSTLRADLEPLAEIVQHKGSTECRNGMEPEAPLEPECDFEQARPATDPSCGELPGAGGMTLGGCAHRLDMLRSVLLEGLREERRIGVNPYRHGWIGSTDTHNATPGAVSSIDFLGHIGLADDTAEKRLGEGTATHDGFINSPGGLVAAWATENTRSALFAAFRRREVYATSGPRIRLRTFAGWDYPADLCSRADGLDQAYARGVPMGSVLAAGPSSGPPVLFVAAERDPGSSLRPSNPLERVQIVKGWLDAAGATHELVVEVAGEPSVGPGVDGETCEPLATGAETLCATWSDPDFDPTEPAFFYARVLETPSCRWSTRQCAELGADAPPICHVRDLPRVVQQRAWSSPIFIDPS